MTIQINSFDGLLRFIEENDLEPSELDTLITKSLGLWCSQEELLLPKVELLKRLKDYWREYGKIAERPMFMTD